MKKTTKNIHRCQNIGCNIPLERSKAMINGKKVCRKCWEVRNWEKGKRCAFQYCNRFIKSEQTYCYIHQTKEGREKGLKLRDELKTSYRSYF